jgi:hypothetical protein
VSYYRVRGRRRPGGGAGASVAPRVYIRILQYTGVGSYNYTAAAAALRTIAPKRARQLCRAPARYNTCGLSILALLEKHQVLAAVSFLAQCSSGRADLPPMNV